ncbi:MAG TPA: phosphatase PAP2 family protein [Flavobacteriales bacterium]|nr:phosphatase PAP2 family protein [Flavobacteriales bacterium]
MSLLVSLDALDRSAFLAINGAHAPWADGLMLAVSDMRIWFPLYLFFLYLLQRRYGWRGLAWSIPVLALMILCSDSGAVVLFKNTVQRLRPSHVPELEGLIHLLPGPDGEPYRGGPYGFVSSHASNHFAIAAFMAGVLGGSPRWATPLLLFWAALIAYSRVYLGVHYPGDVLVGGLYGLAIGSIFVLVFRRIVQRFVIARS